MQPLTFDNRFTRELPADPDDAVRPRQVEGAAYSRVSPTPVAAARTLAWSLDVAEQLGLSAEDCASQEFADVFAGNHVPDGADPFAMAYAGHQFGNWAGQLGDGRAIALGEVLDTAGEHQTLQLKGAGPTPYSRHADGRAVLRSSVREFLCSEAMHHLGIPTTRALSLVLTGDQVVRDMLYDGHPAPEPGAVVCRVSPSFVRFGSFELPASRGDIDLLRQLAEYTLRHDFPHLETVGEMFVEVCERTAELVLGWMRVGFVHGVLNTDNMSILGLTIDYGPYGWLEDFEPDWTPNTTDLPGRRYAYAEQSQVVYWNLQQLANALLPLVEDKPVLLVGLERYAATYETGFGAMLAERLGWGEHRDTDSPLIAELFQTLQLTETDQVICFRELARVPIDEAAGDDELLQPLQEAFYRPEELVGDVRDAWLLWLRAWAARARDGGLPDAERIARMDAVNPRFVLRNWLAQEAIDAAEAGDPSMVHELLEVLQRPYEEQPGKERFATRRPEWARTRVGSSMLSCSS